MFGHQDEPQKQDNQGADQPAVNDVTAPTIEPATSDASDSYITTPTSHPDPTPTADTPLLEEEADDGLAELVDSPLAPEDDSPGPTPHDDHAAKDDGDDLLSIKQQALEKLTPLVGQLDQSPEEKFRTTMMMIQAADNQALIPKAYEAANEITDEKTRAQALLDIVNEINYFTQH